MLQENQLSYKGKYKPHDRFIIFNDNDEDLTPIRYDLPSPPPLEDIEGYGLQFKDQFFQRPKFSRKLQNLIKEPGVSSSKWAKMEADPDYYEDEIIFINREWQRLEHGYWFFNNGKPTYITPVNYFYLVCWMMDIGHPEFRMRDREFFLFLEMCINDPFCYGFNYPKLRREGATSKATCYRYYRAMMFKNSYVGLQSKTEDDGQKVHEKHMVFAWRKMPFWCSPIFDGKLDSKNTIRFFSPQIKSHEDFGKDALDSIIDFENSSENAYDSQKLHALHNDEVGKIPDIDVSARWRIQKPCLYQGTKKIGIALNTSTVEEMDVKGGKQFKKLCDGSHYNKKDPVTRQTATGLYNFFIPATEGLEGNDPVSDKPFIDKFGFDDVELARKYLMGLRKAYLEAGNIEGAIEVTRQNPIVWKECWLRSVKDCLFDLAIIEYILDKYRHSNADVRTGDFEWENGVEDTKVVWVDNPTSGKFTCSFFFNGDIKYTNAQFTDSNGIRFPRNTARFIGGCDAYKNRTTKGGRKSNGGGAVFWKRDHTVDHPGAMPEQVKSERFICTYNFRPKDPETYCEDMLKMCVYFGCEMFPEINVTKVWDHFVIRGYGGYLFYRTDAKGKLSDTPGAQMSEKIKEDCFYAMQGHIIRNGRREVHPEIMQECKDIPGPEFMTDFDLFTAACCALLGANKSINNQGVRNVPDKQDVEEYFQVFEYPE